MPKALRGIKTSPALVILISLLICAVGTQLVHSLSWGHSSYEMTEWLINYSGGFVRRGLPGTLIGIMSEVTGLQANHLAIAAGMICFLVLLVWLLRRATASFPPALILSCIVMGFPAYQNSIVRKDCLGLLFLLACLIANGSRAPRTFVIFALNLTAGIAILCHEAFVFYALAGFVFFHDPTDPKSLVSQIVRRSFSMLPAGICFLLTLIYHGTPEQAEAVNESLIPLWKTIEPSSISNTGIHEPAAAIAALGWTTEKGLSLSLYMLTSGFYQPFAWIMVFTLSFLLMVLFTRRDSSSGIPLIMQSRIRVISILLIQLVFISPLFLLGVDYGRWLFLWVVGSMILHTTGRRAPVWIESFVETLTRTFLTRLINRIPTREWYLLFFGVPVCWNLHNFLVASPAGRYVEIIGGWF